MGLWSKSDKAPVATVEVDLLDGDRAAVRLWVDEADRSESSYHTVLHFLMYYARLLFFLSYRDTAVELVEWMDDAVRVLAGAPDGEPVSVSRQWTLVDQTAGQPQSSWSSTLTQVGPGRYRCADTRPDNPEDADVQSVVLCHAQKLADTLPALERAYLAVAISGMHEYYREVKHWGNSMSLRPAVGYGMSQARKVLEQQ